LLLALSIADCRKIAPVETKLRGLPRILKSAADRCPGAATPDSTSPFFVRADGIYAIAAAVIIVLASGTGEASCVVAAMQSFG